MPRSTSTLKGLSIFDQTALTTYYTSSTPSHKAIADYIDAKRRIRTRSAPGLPNIDTEEWKFEQALTGTNRATVPAPTGTPTAMSTMSFSDHLQHKYKDIIQIVRAEYPDTDELDDKIEHELLFTYKDDELLKYHHFIVKQQGFRTSTLTKRSPVGTVTSTRPDAEPVLPHAVETAERLQGMADQLNPNLAIDSIRSKYRALMGYKPPAPMRTREPSAASEHDVRVPTSDPGIATSTGEEEEGDATEDPTEAEDDAMDDVIDVELDVEDETEEVRGEEVQVRTESGFRAPSSHGSDLFTLSDPKPTYRASFSRHRDGQMKLMIPAPTPEKEDQLTAALEAAGILTSQGQVTDLSSVTPPRFSYPPSSTKNQPGQDRRTASNVCVSCQMGVCHAHQRTTSISFSISPSLPIATTAGTRTQMVSLNTSTTLTTTTAPRAGLMNPALQSVFNQWSSRHPFSRPPPPVVSTTSTSVIVAPINASVPATAPTEPAQPAQQQADANQLAQAIQSFANILSQLQTPAAPPQPAQVPQQSLNTVPPPNTTFQRQASPVYSPVLPRASGTQYQSRAGAPGDDYPSPGRTVRNPDRTYRPRSAFDRRSKTDRILMGPGGAPGEHDSSDDDNYHNQAVNRALRNDHDSHSTGSRKYGANARVPPYRGGDFNQWVPTLLVAAEANLWDEDQVKAQLYALCEGNAKTILNQRPYHSWTARQMIKQLRSRLGKRLSIAQVSNELEAITMKPGELVADLMCRIDNVACQADPIIDQRIIKCKKQDAFLRAIRTNQPMFYDVHNSITHSDDPDAALRLAIEYERQQGITKPWVQKQIEDELSRRGFMPPAAKGATVSNVTEDDSNQESVPEPASEEGTDDAEVKAAFLDTKTPPEEWWPVIAERLNELERERRRNEANTNAKRNQPQFQTTRPNQGTNTYNKPKFTPRSGTTSNQGQQPRNQYRKQWQPQNRNSGYQQNRAQNNNCNAEGEPQVPLYTGDLRQDFFNFLAKYQPPYQPEEDGENKEKPEEEPKPEEPPSEPVARVQTWPAGSPIPFPDSPTTA